MAIDNRTRPLGREDADEERHREAQEHNGTRHQVSFTLPHRMGPPGRGR